MSRIDMAISRSCARRANHNPPYWVALVVNVGVQSIIPINVGAKRLDSLIIVGNSHMRALFNAKRQTPSLCHSGHGQTPPRLASLSWTSREKG